MLLSHRKQIALQEMELVLKYYQKEARRKRDLERQQIVGKLLETITPQYSPEESTLPADYSAVAARWLDLVSPWFDLLSQSRRVKPIRLVDIRKVLQKEPISTEQLLKAFQDCPAGKRLDERIASAIIGVD
jgi:hypothetical protein